MEARAAGTWPSPVTPDLLVKGAVSTWEVLPDGDDVWWAEVRPTEHGRVAVVRWRDGELTDVTPPDSDARTTVHNYGGAGWWVQDGTVYWSEFGDQRLRKMQVGGEPVLLSPEPEVPAGLRFADGRVTPDGAWFVCVLERHEPDGSVINEVAAVATDGSMEIRTLGSGADFYAWPRVSPDGRQLAWVQWDHPNMPFDVTELWIADLVDGRAHRPRKLMGNGDEAIGHARWTERGTMLVATDRTDWWNVYEVSASDGTVTQVTSHELDIVWPFWVFGESRFVDGVHALSDQVHDRLSDGTQLGSYSSVSGMEGDADSYVFAAASYAHPSAPVRVRDRTLEVLRPPADLGLDPGFLPEPEFITYPTGDGEVAHGLFYAPANPAYRPLPGERPPLVVSVHGGPTSSAGRWLSMGHRFWTSRGFALVDVDYRGSSGYGRRYRNLLRGRWCDIDVQDAIAAARYLAERGDVDGERMVIRGGSAGGSTTLLAAMGGPFAAGGCYFGVSDLAALITDDHKFESRYTFSLVGPYPERADVYAERSAINHIDRITTPLIVLQGADDHVVPPHHSTRIVDGLRERGMTVEYREYPGEGHGFHGAEALTDAITSEHAFYLRVFGLTA